MALASTRVYAGVLPDVVTYPAIAYRVTGSDRAGVLGARGDGLAEKRFRIFSAMKGKESSSYSTVKNLDEAIRLALQGFAGTVTDTTVSPQTTCIIQFIRPDSTVDFYDDLTQTWQVASDYTVFFDDPIPS